MSDQEKNSSSNDENIQPENEVIIKRKSGLKIGIKLFLGLILIGAISALTVGFIANNNYKKMLGAVEIESIYNNISIDNIDIGGMTKSEAKQKIIDETVTPNQNKKIILKSGDKVFDFILKDFGLEYDVDKAVDEAYNFARDGKIKERYEKIMELKAKPFKVELTHKYNEASVLENVSTITEDIYIEPINATMTRSGGVFSIKEGVEGLQMIPEKTAEEVKKLVDKLEPGEVEIFTEPIRPTYTSEEFLQAQTLIGSASTNYSGRGTGRVTNMDVAAGKINGYVVYPGEIFSTNSAFGSSTYDNGYVNAPVIENGELVEGIGGGVCQVSSTLYNALLRAEVEIVERRNHSLKVGYADWGFDATLAGDYIDLKFRNDTDLPVFVESYLSADKVICNIYGKEIHSSGRTLEFQNALIKTVAPGAEKVTYTSDLAKGAQEVKVSALTGYTYEVYKFVYENGTLIDKVLVNTSVYKPRRAEILVGTRVNTAVNAGAPAQSVAADTPAQQNPQPNTEQQNVNQPPAVEVIPEVPIVE